MEYSKIEIQYRYDKVIVSILGVVLVLLYVPIIPKICTVWELGDEAGYLSNAAYFLKCDWSDVRSVMPYFGYGYSILLIPVFLLTQTGVVLIRGAVGVNILCVLGIYILQICILKKIFGRNDQAFYGFIAFISNISPYIVANTIKVNCEVFLTFWFWLITLLLYTAVKKKKPYIYIILGACSAFSFYIHTRAFVIIFAVIAVVAILSIKNHDKVINKNNICLIVSIGIFFALFYVLKLSIINSTQILNSAVSEGSSTVNLITPQYLFERLKWLFTLENVNLYYLSLIAKLFYIICATGTMGIFGYMELFSWSKKKLYEDNDTECAVWSICIFFLMCVSMMIVVCTINGVGMLENFTTIFYNRYYEFTVWPLFLIGTYQCIRKRQTIKKYLWITILVVGLAIVTMQLSDYLCSEEIHMDTARIASFSVAVNENNNFSNLIIYLAMSMVLILFVSFVLNKRYRGILLCVLGITIGRCSLVNLDTILQIHQKAEADTKIAECILEGDDNKRVYMLNEPFQYDYFYSRMQVLIKDKTLYVVEPNMIDDIRTGDYILTYYNSTYKEELIENSDCLVKEGTFCLYKKRERD